MKWVSLAIVYIAVATGISTVAGQDRVARTPGSASQNAAISTSQAQAAIERAAAANKFVFIFFWKEQNQQTDKAWNILQPTVAKMADQAETVSIQTTNTGGKGGRRSLRRQPLSHAFSTGDCSCGAVTKAFTSVTR